MSKELVIGNASFDWMEDALIAHAVSLDLKGAVQTLFEGPKSETTFCFLNSASVVLFLDRVARLGGHSGTESAFAAFQRGDTAFKNMPWWDNSIWLPFDVPSVGTMKRDPATFVGSCTSLLTELAEIQRRSPLGLGAKPPGYERMRENISSFYSDPESQLDDDNTMRWMWLALRDAADIAINSQAILWCGP